MATYIAVYFKLTKNKLIFLSFIIIIISKEN